MLTSEARQMKNSCIKPDQSLSKKTKKKKTDLEPQKKDDIWEIGDESERQRIRDFWIQLGEEERKQLVKLEKEAVLKKMKEQQKQTCSCNVCGRRRLISINFRSDIESQLELLYNTYYEELEIFSNMQISSPDAYRQHPHAIDYHTHHHHNHIPHLVEEELEHSDDYDEVEGSDSEDSGIMEFGTSLTVKGGILTVADDFLKNDGQKFLDLMEQLAQKKNRPPMDDKESLPSEDEEEYEGSNSDGYESEEHMSDQQKIEEGRRMFQIFAAKMFEQRVLTAYREKAAMERAAKLVQELEEEESQKRLKEEAKQKKLEKERERQRNLKQKQLEEKKTLELKKKQEAEEKARLLREESIRQIKAQEDARIAELARQDALLKEKELQKERQKQLAEEKLQKEKEEKRKMEEFAKAKKEAEEKAKILAAQKVQKAINDAKRKAEEERLRKEKEERLRKEKDEFVKRANEQRLEREKEKAAKEAAQLKTKITVKQSKEKLVDKKDKKSKKQKKTQLTTQKSVEIVNSVNSPKYSERSTSSPPGLNDDELAPSVKQFFMNAKTSIPESQKYHPGTDSELHFQSQPKTSKLGVELIPESNILPINMQYINPIPMNTLNSVHGQPESRLKLHNMHNGSAEQILSANAPAVQSKMLGNPLGMPGIGNSGHNSPLNNEFPNNRMNGMAHMNIQGINPNVRPHMYANTQGVSNTRSTNQPVQLMSQTNASMLPQNMDLKSGISPPLNISSNPNGPRAWDSGRFEAQREPQYTQQAWNSFVTPSFSGLGMTNAFTPNAADRKILMNEFDDEFSDYNASNNVVSKILQDIGDTEAKWDSPRAPPGFYSNQPFQQRWSPKGNLLTDEDERPQFQHFSSDHFPGKNVHSFE
ncbi:hypothetical protein HDV01_003336 [Terramyces sp. JEL0728]|nr:hypothetical protein HDV01_003336 [Terramyces sp. JEL0728]